MLAAGLLVAATSVNGVRTFLSYLDVSRISSPGSPASGFLRLFSNNITGKLACLDSTGADCMPAVTAQRPFTLSSSQILNLLTTPIEVVPAPVSGHVLAFQELSCKLLAGTPYVNVGGQMNLVYTGQVTSVMLGGATQGVSSIMTSAVDAYSDNRPATTGTSIINTFVPSVGLSISKITNNFTVGTGTLSCVIVYSDMAF